MSQAEPLTATFSRDEIEKRINESLEREGEINREFTEVKPSINDLIYDELRNIHGFLQERLGQDGVLDSIDERICEANNLLFDIKAKQVNTNELRKVVAKDDEILEDDYGKPLMTQKDVDEYMESVKDYWVEPEEEGEKVKKVKFSKNERHILYRALGSRASTLRNQIGYTRVNEDGTLREQISKCEELIRKIKES
tara:strand:- start:1321 stop:1908 length:588 start_codon:yes stop_codon:yes gene_type:complete